MIRGGEWHKCPVAAGHVGRAPSWDEIVIDGDIAACDASVSFLQGGRTLAVATIGRDSEALAQGQHLAEAE